LHSHLDKLGFEVPVVVSSGEEALRRITEVGPDLILMDITLEGRMTGIEAAEEIRKSFDIPVVFLSAHDDIHTIRRARLSEPYGYITKPYNMTTLLSTIETALYKCEIDARLRESEKRERLAHETLDLLNRSQVFEDTIRDILLTVKKIMGFDAVAIRLREGDDFPCYVTSGFSDDFVRAERFLCARDQAGKILRDQNGKPMLECMCGNILSGRTNPALPFFTERGSFWTNSTTKFLATTTETQRQTRTRYRCNSEGYKSLALIPLRSDKEIIGLLQLNDHRQNQFTPEMISFFECLGASIGISLSRKRAEETLIQKNEELERFVYTVSHDLKTPLITFKTYLGFLGEDIAKRDEAEIKKDVGFLQSAADKMEQMLSQLLEISCVGRVENVPVRISFRELVDEALNAAAGRIAEKKVDVQVADLELVLYGDRRLSEIWQNLIENAVKYMGDQALPRIEIGAEIAGPETIFFVRDNGMGIDLRHKDRVFSLFTKLDPKSEGSGIGLALVKRIVESYQGRIWLDSEGPSQGACFYFTLPEALERQAEGV